MITENKQLDIFVQTHQFVFKKLNFQALIRFCTYPFKYFYKLIYTFILNVIKVGLLLILFILFEKYFVLKPFNIFFEFQSRIYIISKKHTEISLRFIEGSQKPIYKTRSRKPNRKPHKNPHHNKPDIILPFKS